jgi:hypothetical protein
MSDCPAPQWAEGMIAQGKIRGERRVELEHGAILQRQFGGLRERGHMVRPDHLHRRGWGRARRRRINTH